jgi:cell division protein FtsI/penicillin-binding protein 2
MGRSSSLPRRANAARPVNANSPRRVFAFGVFLSVWILLILGRLYGLEVIEYVKWLGVEQKQQQHTRPLPALRGTIYDRARRELAIAVPVESVGAAPREVQDAGIAATLLAPLVGVEAGELESRLHNARRFFFVKHGISDKLAERVRSLGLAGISVDSEMKRVYPRGSLAAAVMGYAGTEDQGLAGLESGLDSVIAGQPGRMLLSEDAHGHVFHSTEWKGRPGANVVLTLDADIQAIVQATVEKGVADHHAAGAVAVVAEPSTGRILAMVSEPTFDPNRYDQFQPETRTNRAIQWVYEPGSMFKMVAYSGALEEGLISPEEMIDCQGGAITIDRHVFHDAERGMGVVTIEQSLVHSSDVAAIKIGLRLGQDRLYQYIRRYGFGSRTGIDLPGEEQGLLKPPARWSGTSIGAVPIGQEVGVTALQVVSAYSAIANRGVLIPPRIIERIEQGSTVRTPAPRPSRRVVSERTAQIVKHMLASVVQDGTGRSAQLNGYSAAGKTGTAQKIDASGAYSHSHFVSSFVGMAPVDHPAIVVLISIDSPVGAYYGAEVAAPVFKSIAEQVLTRMNVPKDRPTTTIAANRVPPRAAALRKPARHSEAIEDGPPPEISTHDGLSRDEIASSVKPVALTNASGKPSDTMVLPSGPLVTVPDLTGLAQRPVATQCAALGLDLVVSGSGLALEQYPQAGGKVPQGTKIRVRFER